MGMVRRRWVWVETMDVVVRRYIDFLILIIATPLVSALFCSSIPTFCSFKKNIFLLYIYTYIIIVKFRAIEHIRKLASLTISCMF